ncbi:MAG: SDR family oxidoreductase [Ruminococcus sp.]|jgi:NAD(P)-dependent dehydrogenase (short-subunit alcohol dehydrogenase family)|nr:SDR family oxidoreductase [Ruminococcus sp.]
MVDVKGKWALVTGGARGIGALVAEFMAKRGANIIIQSRSLEHNKKMIDKLTPLGVECKSVACDLQNPDSVYAMLKEIDSFGVDVDFVFNNAAVQIAYRTNPFDTPVADFVDSFYINTIAPAFICYHFLPKMQKKGFGRIINTTSGIDKEPQQAGYSASKAALDKFTRDLGTLTEGTDVIISLTDPGWCRTDLGGPGAPNAPESAIPGVVVGAFVDDKKCGRLFPAGRFHNLGLEEAVKVAESMTRD